VARALLEEVAHSADNNLSEDETPALTDREAEVLRLVARGWCNQEIADNLMISEATVRAHVSHILAKLDLASRTQAALYALRKGWASLADERVF
jgi:NarL family two-component system response regulator LiaR